MEHAKVLKALEAIKAAAELYSCKIANCNCVEWDTGCFCLCHFWDMPGGVDGDWTLSDFIEEAKREAPQ